MSDCPAVSLSTYTSELEQLSDEDFWKLAIEVAQGTPKQEAQVEQFLICRLTQGQCILSLSTLHEIVSPPVQITRFPAAPSWMPGIVAWRGQTIAVIDLKAYLLNQQSTNLADYANHCVLIIKCPDHTLGLLVADVGEITGIDPAQIIPPESPPTVWGLPVREQAIAGIHSLDTSDPMPVLNSISILTDAVQQIAKL